MRSQPLVPAAFGNLGRAVAELGAAERPGIEDLDVSAVFDPLLGTVIDTSALDAAPPKVIAFSGVKARGLG